MTLLLLMAVLVPASPPEAQFLDRMARQAYTRGRFAEALTLFGEVAEEAPSARVFYNMAVTAELAGDRAFAYSLFARYRGFLDGDEPRTRRTYARQRMKVLARKLALVRIESRPPGAAISIDGRARETFERTPATLVLPPGQHRVRVTRPGYVSATAEVVARVGKRAEVTLPMTREQGRLRVEVGVVAGAVVNLVEATGGTQVIPPNETATVNAGAFELRVEAPRHKPYVSAIVVPSNGSVERTVRLLPLPPEQSKTLFRCRQGRRELWIDGVRRANTPLALMLDVGEHVVELRDGSGMLWKDTVSVMPGRNLLVDIDLETSVAQR